LIVAQVIALQNVISQKAIGQKFGVTQSLISGIVRGKYKNYFTYKG
jgi:predicted XRE-type DNA-binding protein